MSRSCTKNQVLSEEGQTEIQRSESVQTNLRTKRRHPKDKKKSEDKFLLATSERNSTMQQIVKRKKKTECNTANNEAAGLSRLDKKEKRGKTIAK